MFRNKSIFTINFSIFIIMFGLGTCFTHLPEKMSQLSGSITFTGFLASAFGITYILSQYPLGKAADRYGFRFVIFVGFLFCGVAGVVYYYAVTPSHLLIGRIIQGIGEAPLWSLSPILLTLQFPEKKAQIIGWYTASFHFGLTLGPLAGTVIADLFGVNTTFLYFSGASILGGIIILFSSPAPVKKLQNKSNRPDFLTIIKPFSKSVLMGVIMYGGCYGLIVSIIPAYMLSVKSLDYSFVNTAFSLSFFIIGIIQVFFGRVVNRKNLGIIIPASLLLIAIGLMIVIFGNSLILLIGLLLYNAGLGAFSIASLFYIQVQGCYENAGALSGIYFMLWGAGYFIIPFIFGMLKSTDLISIVLVGQVCLLIFIALIIIKQRKL